MKNIILTFITLLFITNCGKNGHINYYNPPANDLTPDFLSLEDSNCQTNTNRDRFHLNYGEQKVHRYVEGEYKYEKINFTEKSIVSDILIHENTYLDWNSNNEEWKNDISQFKKLYLCRDNSNFGHYQDRSLEMVALSSLATVNESYEFYKQITNNNILENNKIKLLIHPHISMGDNVGYFTDNAFYYNVKNFSDIIAVIPHSLELPPYLAKYSSFIGFIPYWKQQLVLAHEFGHFVFENHSHLLGDQGRVADSLSDAAKKSLSSSGPFELNQLFKSAFHEAFADLFGTLVSNANTKTFYAFEPESRDIFNPEFKYNNKIYSKILTKKIIQTPDLLEEHNLGAFLAYGIYHSLDQFFPGDKVKKGKILIEWANRIKQDNPHSIYSEKGFFIKTLRLFEITLEEQVVPIGRSVNDVREVLKKYLPIIFE